MELLQPLVRAYIESHSAAEPPLLSWLRRETHLKTLYPQMLSGPYQGRVLAMLSRLLRPRRVLEIGAFTGYSAICLAEGLAPGGAIDSLERNPELDFLLGAALARAGLAETVQVRYGDARSLLPALEGPYDLIFLDADKAEYPEYYELGLPKLRAGGLLIADNVLWDGKVLDDRVQDKETEGLRRFTDRLCADPRMMPLLLPVRDGLMLALRLPG
ncbi:MAG: class I SAM-dependent methyltransferase [Bacteroidia bacterium]|nr:class I SAM-dependent methyltransferase [Bacteroidia bacterium]